MYENVIELVGREPGPTSMILVGVHGNEKCGVEALNKILSKLEIQKGKAFFAYGNPQSIDQNVRYTEANLNRMFKSDELLSEKEKESYEYSRAQFLKKYLDQADVLLDIHASYTPASQRFIICEPNSKEIVKYLPFSLIVSGFDQVEPGGTDYYMNSIGKIGICVECGYLGDQKSTEIAEESIYTFLRAREHVSGERQIYTQNYIQMYSIYITKNNFKLTKEFSDFEEINLGQVIGTDGKEEVRAQKDSIILFARNVETGGEEAFLLGEKKKA
ncbi:MAG: succinylglutamate desuccinylase/aspartoacylase family protein [bacterium]